MTARVTTGGPPDCWVLGTPVSVATMEGALQRLEALVAHRAGGYVCAADVHSLMVARTNLEHQEALRGAKMVLADGAPIVLTMRMRGLAAGRVAGPDFMLAAFDQGQARGWRHFLLGGAQATLDQLVERLSTRFPGAVIAGAHSPPFRELSAAEESAVIRQIQESKADVVWVGLGCPKQERWMARLADALPGVVQIGVGAAFDFHSGVVKRAPTAMRRIGLEWLHRLVTNPRRLWRRYVLNAPAFVAAAAWETLTHADRPGPTPRSEPTS